MSEPGGFFLGENNNLAIRASAGSGKTFQLAMRFISLLFMEPELDPAQIVAITFTRKAAGEIFDKIIDQLLLMMRDPAVLTARVEQKLLPEQLSPAALPELLGRILCSCELQIGTIDSFLVRIIQAFSPDFGLAGTVKVAEEKSSGDEADVLLQVIRRERENLLPLLREYAENRDAREITATLKTFLEQNYAFYLLYPDEALWGNFPEIRDDLREAERLRICDTLAVGMEHYDYPDRLLVYFRQLLKAARLDEPRDLKAFPPVEESDGELRIRYGSRKAGYPVSREMYMGISRLYRHLAVVDLRRKQSKTRAAYHLLKLFDELYAANVRGQGRLTFRDLPKVLGELDPEIRLDLEYRLDTRNRHYMLDEFQDTGDQQWRFMENLMSEAVQGPEQSFFMVGDVKQSLYQWRQGNPKLFDWICRKYLLETRSSDRSFRSAPAVIEAVNEVFSHPERQPEPLRKVMLRMGFAPHDTAVDASGFATMIQVPKEEEAEAKVRRIMEILDAVRPLERGLSAAILVRSNQEVEFYKQALRQQDPALPVTSEGAVKPGESMACSLLILLLKGLAHPGDPVVRNALPLFSFSGEAAFGAEKLALRMQLPATGNWDEFFRHLQRILDTGGILEIANRFRMGFERELSGFDRERLEVVVQRAREFTGNPEEFLQVLTEARGAGRSLARTIQIMTIHKSKGLEFDMVILPELGVLRGAGYAELEVEPMPETGNADFAPSWIGYRPNAASLPYLPELQGFMEMLDDDARYEKCCGLYVAMTRAKRGLYMMIKDDLGNEGKSFRADQLLGRALTGPGKKEHVIYETGDPGWYLRQLPVPENVPPSGSGWELENIPVRPAEEIVWRTPSGLHAAVDADGEDSVSFCSPAFRFEESFAAELGTRLHRMFESVEYWETMDPERVRRICGGDPAGLEAWKIWELATGPESEIPRCLAKPAGPSLLWREKRFWLQDGRGGGIAGCFDRVDLFLDASGRFREAVISDYKSDDLDTAEAFWERHRLQLEAYRTALSRMTGIPEARIRCRLLALRLGRKIEL